MTGAGIIRFDCALTRGDFTLDAAFAATSGITALFGPSGSGKSTILALMAGLLQPSRGLIAFGDRVVVDTREGIAVAKHNRRIGLVFQDSQLFPHMTVSQNLKFAQYFSAASRSGIELAPVVAALGIEGLLTRRPPGLSGGEKQRVALARALLSGPDVLLLDEPLASLDAARREEILPLIERMRDEFAVPMLYVSHSAGEVLRLANHVVKLDRGRVVWSGDPNDPASGIRYETASSDRAPFPAS